MDVPAICRLAGKAKDTVERSEAERCAEASPSLRELHGDIVILDDADRGKVIIHFPAAPDQRTRRWLKMCGFFGAGDGGATWWRKRTFRRRENIALGSARHCVQRIIESREKIDAAEAAQFQRETAHSLCA